MDAGQKRLGELLHGDSQFIIPLFQRFYEWDRENWSALWDDILAQLEPDAPTGHFMGSIVCMQGKGHPGDPTPYVVIDGQQRLITFTALFCALRDLSQKILPSLAALVEDHYLVDAHLKGYARYKVLPRLRDRKAFYAVVDASEGSHAHARVTDARDFYLQRLRAELKEHQPERLQDIFNVVKDRLLLVSIVLDQDESPYAIFETLNSRGKKLKESDLIRSHIFMNVGLDDQDEFDEGQWRPFEDSFAKLGDHPELSATDFYRDFLMREGRYVRRDAIYASFREMLAEDAQPPADLVAALSRVAAHYQWMARPHLDPALVPSGAVRERLQELRERDGDGRITRELGRLLDLDVSVVNPLMLSLLERFDAGTLPHEELLGCLRAIESFVVRRSIAGESTRPYSRFFPESVASLDPGSAELKSLCLRLYSRGWPGDDAFTAALLRFPIYWRNRQLTRLALQVVEEEHESKEIDVAQLIAGKKLQIEHVMPQTIADGDNGDGWPAMLGEDWREVHKRCLHTIGNLTLTAYNPELSNKPYADKCLEFATNSKLDLNTYFAKVDVWNEVTIEERGRALAAELAGIFPSASEYLSVEEIAAVTVVHEPAPGPVWGKEAKKLREVFWEGFTEYMAQHRPDVPCAAPWSDSYLSVYPGIGGGCDILAMLRDHNGVSEVRTHVWLESTTARTVYAYLHARADEIEAHFQDASRWIDEPSLKSCSFEVCRETDLATAATPDNYAWLATHIDMFRDVFWPLLGKIPPVGEEKRWDEELFFAAAEKHNPWSVPALRRLYDWATQNMPELSWGTGKQTGACVPYLKVGDRWHQFFVLRTDGSVALRFAEMKKRPPFDSEAMRQELLAKLNELPYFDLPEWAIDEWPRIPASLLGAPEVLNRFVGVLDWFVREVST